jgi:hypothetical protein
MKETTTQHEFTFIDPVLGSEVMVDIDSEYNIVDCYVCKRDLMDIPFSAKWKQGKNPRFYHNKNQFKNIAMFFVVEPANEEEFMFLHETMRKNKITHYEILEV